jgi:hypothetical protein
MGRKTRVTKPLRAYSRERPALTLTLDSTDKRRARTGSANADKLSPPTLRTGFLAKNLMNRPSNYPQNLILAHPLTFGVMESRLIMASILHSVDQFRTDSSKGSRDRNELFNLISSLLSHLRAGSGYVACDTNICTLITNALSMYNTDRKSTDHRITPSIATGLIATDLAAEDHPSPTRIENLINEIKVTINNALADDSEC